MQAGRQAGSRDLAAGGRAALADAAALLGGQAQTPVHHPPGGPLRLQMQGP
jgi:hypothetical protein